MAMNNEKYAAYRIALFMLRRLRTRMAGWMREGLYYFIVYLFPFMFGLAIGQILMTGVHLFVNVTNLRVIILFSLGGFTIQTICMIFLAFLFSGRRGYIRTKLLRLQPSASEELLAQARSLLERQQGLLRQRTGFGLPSRETSDPLELDE